MAWFERTFENAGAANSIHAIEFDVACFDVVGRKRDCARPASPQRVRLNRRRTVDTLLIGILQYNELAALGRKANEFKNRRSTTDLSKPAETRPKHFSSRSDLHGGQTLDRPARIEPLKDCRKRAPKGLKGRKLRQLMPKHPLPRANDRLPSCRHYLKRNGSNALVFTLARE